jgi:hypothetical protein
VAEVSGTVTYKGEPIPGGNISFFSTDGDAVDSSPIIDGKYTLHHAPVGQVSIAVRSGGRTMPGAGGKGMPEGMRKYAADKRAQTVPEGDNPPPKLIELPQKYADHTNSGLSYEVKPGPQIYDFDLPP